LLALISSSLRLATGVEEGCDLLVTFGSWPVISGSIMKAMLRLTPKPAIKLTQCMVHLSFGQRYGVLVKKAS
jgi:bifunctional N-acetylglucosamine-1-phosphate-uridyltransferase/glucosamine-1-phosphate-acetyltransferase GlmU-like protein